MYCLALFLFVYDVVTYIFIKLFNKFYCQCYNLTNKRYSKNVFTETEEHYMHSIMLNFEIIGFEARYA